MLIFSQSRRLQWIDLPTLGAEIVPCLLYIYINNQSPNLSAEKPCLSLGLQKIVRLSAEMSSDDRVNPTDSSMLSSASGSKVNTPKPRPNGMRARRARALCLQ